MGRRIESGTALNRREAAALSYTLTTSRPFRARLTLFAGISPRFEKIGQFSLRLINHLKHV